MTILQKMLKALYPLTMSVTPQKTISEPIDAHPVASFYDLEATVNDGRWFDFDKLRDKKVLIVNTASNCGYTPQFGELQQLQNKFKNELVVLGFPSNDFFNQESGDDASISAFCVQHYNVQFALMKKSVVSKKQNQNKVYQWLTNSAKNGWNDKAPDWNFSKYLIDKTGRLTHYFSPSVAPFSEKLITAIES